VVKALGHKKSLNEQIQDSNPFRKGLSQDKHSTSVKNDENSVSSGYGLRYQQVKQLNKQQLLMEPIKKKMGQNRS
jgi:hypothetical protein